MVEPARQPLRLLNRLVFSPPLLSSNDQLRRHILWLLLIRIIFFTLLIAVTVLLGSLGTAVILPPDILIVAFISILFIISIGSAAIAQKPGLNLRRFGIVQILFDTVFAALLVYGTGCSQSIFTPVFILPVIAGGLIMSRKGGLFAAASATLLYGADLLLEYFGLVPMQVAGSGFVPAHDLLKAANLFAVYGTTFFVTGLLSGTLAARLQSTEEALSQASLEYDRLSLLYKQIFDDISTGIITTDENECITSCNTAAGRITGYAPEEATGRRLDEVIPGLQLKNSANRQVMDLTKKDGTVIRIGYSVSHLNLPSLPSAQVDEDNHCKIITLQDISKIEAMEKRVREAEKMAAIGEMSASIAHDFRNPLAAISGSAQLLASEAANCQGPGKQLSTIIYRESKRMARTISEFLQFARPAPVQAEWCSLDRVIEEAIASSKHLQNALAKKKISVTLPEKIDAFGDRQQLQTILVHLLENGLIFSQQQGGGVHLRATEIEREAESWLCIEIEDQGQGIDPSVQDKIFQPFFTTREQGTGLGLAIVSQIVELHNGSIEVESEPGQGCTMKIYLPLPSYNG